MFVSIDGLEHLLKRALHMHLDVPELFIALVLEHFGEERDLVVFAGVRAHAVNNGCGPFDNQRFQAVLLHQVRVHELLHGLNWQSRLPRFGIEL